MQAFADVQALAFDVFGTVVDWRGGVARESAPFLARYAPGADPAAFADAWRRRYAPAMAEVGSGRRPFVRLDVLHRENLLPSDYERNAEHLPFLNGELHNAVIGFLAQVPSMFLLLNQEDLTLETEQQNLPGSTAQYPNWQRKMKLSIEDLQSGKASATAAMFRDQLTRTGRR